MAAAKRLNLSDFERAVVARLCELAMVAILNLAGFEWMDTMKPCKLVIVVRLHEL